MENVSIAVEDTSAAWVGSTDQPKNYTLELSEYRLGPKAVGGGVVTEVYGWTEEVTYGEDKGMVDAFVPVTPTEEDDSDCMLVGRFPLLEGAMEAILAINHPSCGTYL